MTQIQQQRLIGALLLVCVFSGVAYFLMSSAKQSEEKPIDLTPGVEQYDFTSSIEVLSEGDIEVIGDDTEALVDPNNLEAIETALDTSKKEALAPVVENIKDNVLITPPPVAKQESENVSDSWFLQLASFSIEKNAQALKKQTIALGYDAKIHATDSPKGKIYRVRIGPNDSKPMLQKTSSILNKKLGLKSQIVQKTK